MGKKPTKAADNAYCIARMAAAICNDRLSSREGAAEATGIDRTRLARIELGSLFPHPEEVQLLADTYKAPELLNWHCSNDCPIGRDTVTQIELTTLSQISIKLYNAVKDLPAKRDLLLAISDDGIISDEERPKLNDVLTTLGDISKHINTLKLWAQKHLNE